MKSIITGILLFTLPFISFSQDNKSAFNKPFTLSGIIKDSQTGETLPFTTVFVKGSNIGTTTNADGYFTMHKVPTDTSTISISYIGYDKKEIKLSPTMAKDKLIILVNPSSVQIQEVVISAEREDIMQIKSEETSTIKMTPNNLEQLPNIGEKDIMRSFQLMPGISASNESSSGLYVRGGTPDQNLIVYDGFTIYHVDHLYGFYSAFNSNAIKDVQLYKGGFESRFGGRLSSVTEITGKDGNQNNFNIGGEVSLLSLNAYAELPIGDKFTSIFTYRRSYKGFLYNEIFDSFNEELETQTPPAGAGRFSSQKTTVSSYFYDLNGKFTYKPTDKDIISLSIFNGTDHLDNGYEVNTPQRLADMGIDFDMKISDLTNYGNFGTGLKWSRKWSPKLYGNTTLSYSNYYSDRIMSRTGNITPPTGEGRAINSGNFEENNLIDYSLKSDYQNDLSNLVQLKFGVFGTQYDIKYDFIQNDTVSILNKHDLGLLAGGYVQGSIRFLNNKLQVNPGLRSSYYNLTEKMYFEPRISANYKISNKLIINGAWGKYYQFANRITREDITSGSKDFWTLSNDDNIPVSNSEHYIAGLSYELTKYLFSVEGYYKKLDGLSEYSLRYDVNNQGVNYEENFFNGIGFTKGIEFLAQKKTGLVKGWLSYTLGEAKNQFDIYGNDYFSANQDVTHEFKVVALYNYKKWDFSATWIYATGRPYTAPSGAYTVELLDGTTQDYFSVTSKNSLRLPDYHRMDISANYKLFNSSKREIGYIGFSVFNLYNRTNTWYNQYEIVEGEVVETKINYMGFMPNFTLSLKLR
ncbi:MAG: TonB-dependent receptor [Prolixibacteraceae bacterium]|nr:TonB-dependent receptor [Prolixibacteraceae bacterium]